MLLPIHPLTNDNVKKERFTFSTKKKIYMHMKYFKIYRNKPSMCDYEPLL